MTPSARKRITEFAEAIAPWEEHGFVILPGYVPRHELTLAQRARAMLFPTPEAFHDGVDDPRNAQYRGDEFAGITHFPFASVEWSLLAVHPRLIALAEALLGTDDLRLYEAEAWAKYTGAADYDQ